MRAVIFILIIVVILFIAGVASGLLNINQTRDAKEPQVTATRNGVTAKGGQAPAFDVETGSVKVGSKQTTVKVPEVTIQKRARGLPGATTNNAMCLVPSRPLAGRRWPFRCLYRCGARSASRRRR